jgi:hypothetical protein
VPADDTNLILSLILCSFLRDRLGGRRSLLSL